MAIFWRVPSNGGQIQVGYKKTLFSTNISLHRVLSTMRPSTVIKQRRRTVAYWSHSSLEFVCNLIQLLATIRLGWVNCRKCHMLLTRLMPCRFNVTFIMQEHGLLWFLFYHFFSRRTINWRNSLSLENIYISSVSCFKQEFSYRKQIERQLRTQYFDGINSNPVTLKSRIRVTQGLTSSKTSNLQLLLVLKLLRIQKDNVRCSRSVPGSFCGAIWLTDLLAISIVLKRDL